MFDMIRLLGRRYEKQASVYPIYIGDKNTKAYLRGTCVVFGRDRGQVIPDRPSHVAFNRRGITEETRFYY